MDINSRVFLLSSISFLMNDASHNTILLSESDVEALQRFLLLRLEGHVCGIVVLFSVYAVS